MASKYRQELVGLLIEHMERQFRWGGPTAQLQLSYYEEALREAAIRVAANHCTTSKGKPCQLKMASKLGINRNTLRTFIKTLGLSLRNEEPSKYPPVPKSYIPFSMAHEHLGISATEFLDIIKGYSIKHDGVYQFCQIRRNEGREYLAPKTIGRIKRIIKIRQRVKSGTPPHVDLNAQFLAKKDCGQSHTPRT